MIRDILTEDLVQTKKCYESWREAATGTAKLLLEKGKIKEEFVNSVIETVEKYGPYMILVPKVCFFHGVPGDNVKEPCLALSVFENDVVFDDFDSQVIRCCFVFGAVDKDSHMEMLMSVASLLQDEKFISLITNNGDKAEIMERIQHY